MFGKDALRVGDAPEPEQDARVQGVGSAPIAHLRQDLLERPEQPFIQPRPSDRGVVPLDEREARGALTGLRQRSRGDDEVGRGGLTALARGQADRDPLGGRADLRRGRAAACSAPNDLGDAHRRRARDEHAVGEDAEMSV
jgi:hypothetical protein